MAPKKYVAVTHGSVCMDLPNTGVHKITVTKTGNLNTGKQTNFKGTFAEAVDKGKWLTLKMGEGARLWTHGASENTVNYVVARGKIVKLKW